MINTRYLLSSFIVFHNIIMRKNFHRELLRYPTPEVVNSLKIMFKEELMVQTKMFRKKKNYKKLLYHHQ